MDACDNGFLRGSHQRKDGHCFEHQYTCTVQVANSTLKSKSKPLSHPKIPYDHNDHPYSSSYNSNLSLWTDRIHPDSPTAWNGGYYSGFPDIVSEQLLSKFDIWNTQVPAGSHLERYSQSHMDPNYISQLAADVFTTVAMYGSEFYNGNDSYASSSSPHSSISDGGFEQPPGYFDHTIHGMKQETISPINSPPVSPNTDIFKPHAKDPNMGELIGNVLNFDTSYGVYQFPV